MTSSTTCKGQAAPRLGNEIVAGITTFFTIAYVLIVHPKLLATPGTGMSFAGVLTATVLLCFLCTLLMGWYAKLPIAIAPGMGINAFFTSTLILEKHIPFPIALGMVFWSGVLSLVFAATPLRKLLTQAIPNHLRMAVSVGIGLFLMLIGLKEMGLLQASPETMLTFKPISLPALLSLCGMTLSILLLRRKNPAALLLGIFSTAIAAWATGLTNPPSSIFSMPDFHSVLCKIDLLGSLTWALIPSILSLCFTDFFDAFSTFVGISHAYHMDEHHGEPKYLKEGMIVNALSSILAGFLGSSSGTPYIESVAGIEVGGRTGRTAMVTALCFLPCLFMAPLLEMIPTFSTAPVLVLVGMMMFRSAFSFPLSEWEDVIPSCLLIALIPLTFSITQGILFGFASHTILYAFSGRRKELSNTMVLVGLISLGLLFVLHGTSLK